MIWLRPFFLTIGFLVFLLIAWAGNTYCSAQLTETQGQLKTFQEEKEPEKIVVAPQDVKQRTGIWVFFIWMWISIIVLVFFLRLKIKEVDRLNALRFFSAEKK